MKYYRCVEQVAVSGVHDLRAEELSGSEAVRASLVLRQSAGLQTRRLRQETPDHRHKTRLLGVVSGRKGVHMQVNLFFSVRRLLAETLSTHKLSILGKTAD